eukprot:gb/GFBE01007388.1/.p1 GENE.gb/GFBE01007388.1/~~gb/GFBE01007388.1/.p1  ORF type:complete len:102 (+),score=9.28 gb/GFBE01007388.1/:1-306(+)
MNPVGFLSCRHFRFCFPTCDSKATMAAPVPFLRTGPLLPGSLLDAWDSTSTSSGAWLTFEAALLDFGIHAVSSPASAHMRCIAAALVAAASLPSQQWESAE